MSTFIQAGGSAHVGVKVSANSFLTLRYRLAARGGAVLVSTYEGNPATLQLGSGQLIPELENCLIGMQEGQEASFVLPPEKAYGMRNPELLQHISLEVLKENSPENETYEIGDLVEFNAPSGGKFTGVLRTLDEQFGLFDFNHPLAGQDVVFDVRIISIL